jgi:Leucine-rich repeat (LRR) protein
VICALHGQVNKMKRLPDAIGDLRNLSTLSLARNQLEYLPASLKHLADLKYIDVHVNCLHTVLPEEVFAEWDQKNAEREAVAVFVDSPATPATPMTPATPITPSTPSRRLQRRKALHADPQGEQSFATLLAPIGVPLPKGGVVLLAGLRDFECSYNELSELPDMSEMVGIDWCLGRKRASQVTSYPKNSDMMSFSMQENLTRINVAHNHLRDLPEVICELVGLEKIECGDNRVRSVPTSVSKLTRLTLLRW